MSVKLIAENIDLKTNELYKRTPPPSLESLQTDFCSMDSQPQSCFDHSTEASETCRISDTNGHPVFDAPENEEFEDIAMSVSDYDVFSDIRAQPVPDVPENEDFKDIAKGVSADDAFSDIRAQPVPDTPENEDINDTPMDDSVKISDMVNMKVNTLMLINEVVNSAKSYNSDIKFLPWVKEQLDPAG